MHASHSHQASLGVILLRCLYQKAHLHLQLNRLCWLQAARAVALLFVLPTCLVAGGVLNLHVLHVAAGLGVAAAVHSVLTAAAPGTAVVLLSASFASVGSPHWQMPSHQLLQLQPYLLVLLPFSVALSCHLRQHHHHRQQT